MRRAWMVLALGGCWGEKAIEVSLQVPSAAVAAPYDTSCVSAVEIYVDGANYPNDDADFLRDCIDLTGCDSRLCHRGSRGIGDRFA